MSGAIDDRITPRFQKGTTVFIELDAGNFGVETKGGIVICRSLDLSNSGVQVVLDRKIEQRTILRLCLETRGRAPIFVVAEAMWQRRNEDSGCGCRWRS